MALIDIAELARRSGMPASTLRYYEELGLIDSLGRRGLRRTFDENVMNRLSLIALGQMAGLSLTSIGQMLGSGSEVAVDRALLTAKANEIDEAIKRMTAVRDGLRHAADCPAPSHAQCPTFRRLQRAALGRRRAPIRY
ncbi:MerR family transcriptional regulator [Sphingomonas sp. ABOLD]|uniref:DNA-binding transcriptional MerR regulator n=1 Tax=Sphingomonas trueperi TaxID=53317 RepID=A0A7X5Y1X1_9SPHN|nr:MULTISPECIES: helix-turn-helix domain-containing protein [Sphingomonas]NJB99509.1 DNA-binding transcriptional MerR regulator [Sphingomonas trueperi]RSV43795.1 MerR family transcriptional regulator [Sphingomonas sp. ABOLD]